MSDLSTAGAATPNPFDPEKFRLDTLVDPGVQTIRLITTIPVRKPIRQEFIRVHPEPVYQFDALVLELQEDRETYIVSADMCHELEGELRAVRLHLAMSRNGFVPFVWPLKLPLPDGRSNSWNDSAAIAAEEAKKAWVRVQSNMSIGAYDVHKAVSYDDDPEWPDMSFQEAIGIAFKGRMIDSIGHPVVRRLRGEV